MSTQKNNVVAILDADVRVNGMNLLVIYACLYYLKQDTSKITIIASPEVKPTSVSEIEMFGTTCDITWKRVHSTFVTITIPAGADFLRQQKSVDCIIEAIKQVFAIAYSCKADNVIVNPAHVNLGT